MLISKLLNKTLSLWLINFLGGFIFFGCLLHVPYVFANSETTEKTILIFDNIDGNIKKINNHHKPHKPKRYRNAYNLTPKLNASASAQPNISDLKYIINTARLCTNNHKEIFIVDLRQEPHVMLNGSAISWYGFRNQVPHNLEQELINKLLHQKTTKVYKGLNKLPNGYFVPKKYSLIEIKNIVTEQSAVESLGANYFRLLITDHFAPETSQIDLFIKFVKNLPKNSWLHFHCRGGRGRATTFMAIYDIIQNAQSLTLDEILKRQNQLGGIKLSNTSFKLIRKKWKEPAAKDRYDFMKKFYDYVSDPNGYNKSDWSEWVKKNYKTH